MPVVSGTIPNLVGGVSQQPDALRLPSQCELLDNGYPTPVNGVRKRPPFRHVAKLSSSPLSNAYVFTINRDISHQYEVVITNGDLKVFDLSGVQQTVTFPSGKGYLTATDPKTQFAQVTVADYSFVANKTISPAMTSTLSPVRLKEAVVFFRQGAFSTLYQITIALTAGGSSSASWSDTTGAAAGNADTTQIASSFASFFNTDASFATIKGLVNIFQSGSVVWLQAKASGTDFSITSLDGISNIGVLTFKDATQNFGSLPRQAFDSFQLKIEGDSSNAFDAYYVKWVNQVAGSGSNNNGFWQECTAQGIPNSIDATTMPWQLIHVSGTSWTFGPATWDDRQVGDITSQPPPSFIGRTINDIFFHRNRLGVVAGENIIMSKSSSYFDFWSDTVTQVLDSDRIDVATTHTKVSIINAVAPFDEALILFSDQTQFLLDGGDLLTPKTITAKPTTEYANGSTVCRPVHAGKSVFFTIPRGSFTGLREFTTLPINSDVDATEVSSHVPAYVPGNVFKIAYSTNEDVLAILSSSTPNVIYGYKYYYNDQNQKLQSAWFTWTLDPGDTILNVDFINTDLFAVIQRSDGVYLEVASIELGRVDPGFTHVVNLDNRVDTLVGTFDSGTGLTTWTLPYAMTGGNYQAVLGPAFTGTYKTGTVLNTTAATSTTLTALGDFSAGAIYVGRQYVERHRLSQLVIREYNRAGLGSQASVMDGRLQLNHCTVVFAETGYFRAEVTPAFRDMSSYQFTGVNLGTGNSILGTRVLSKGVFKFSVLARNTQVVIDLVNDTYLPSAFHSLEWEGKYYLRSARI